MRSEGDTNSTNRHESPWKFVSKFVCISEIRVSRFEVERGSPLHAGSRAHFLPFEKHHPCHPRSRRFNASRFNDLTWRSHFF